MDLIEACLSTPHSVAKQTDRVRDSFGAAGMGNTSESGDDPLLFGINEFSNGVDELLSNIIEATENREERERKEVKPLSFFLDRRENLVGVV